MPNSDELLREASKLIREKSNKPFVDVLKHKIGEAVVAAKSTEAAVESAITLTEKEKDHLKQVVETLTSRKLNFSYKVKPVLFGGFKVTVGDWILDATVTGQLNSLRQHLTHEK